MAPGSHNRLRPLEEPLTEEEEVFMRAVPYKAAVGALFYLARATRCDIAYACSQVARFMAQPGACALGGGGAHL